MNTPATAELTIHAATESDHDFDYPAGAQISVSAALAREIVALQALVRGHGLYKVEKFDNSVEFFNARPDADDYDEEDDANNVDTFDPSVSVSNCTLNVSQDSFWYSATEKHGTEEFRSSRQDIKLLTEHFGMEIV